MRAVVTRVSSAAVAIEGRTVGAIDRGFLVLLGVGPEDTAHARIYDRLLSMCVPVRFTGDNFRQEAAQRKMESMKKLIVG